MIPEEETVPDLMAPHIEGPADAHVYDENLVFSIVGLNSGEFVVNSDKVKITKMTDTSCTLDILAGKSFSFNLSYKTQDGTTVDKVITVKSF